MMDRKMPTYYIIMLLSFMVDSVITYFMPYDYTKSSIMIIPYFSIMMFTLLNNTVNNEERFVFAAICGTFYAVIYSSSLAIYPLLYCVCAYLGKKYTKQSKFTYLEALIVFVLTIFTFELVVYWLVRITNVTQLPIRDFAMYRLLPTILFNMVLSVVVFFIHKKMNFEVKDNGYYSKRVE